MLAGFPLVIARTKIVVITVAMQPPNILLVVPLAAEELSILPAQLGVML